MTALLRERLRRQVMNTDAFLSLLEEIAGRDAANQLNTWLETSPFNSNEGTIILFLFSYLHFHSSRKMPK